jgi:hypothetical protein
VSEEAKRGIPSAGDAAPAVLRSAKVPITLIVAGLLTETHCGSEQESAKIRNGWGDEETRYPQPVERKRLHQDPGLAGLQGLPA